MPLPAFGIFYNSVKTYFLGKFGRVKKQSAKSQENGSKTYLVPSSVPLPCLTKNALCHRWVVNPGCHSPSFFLNLKINVSNQTCAEISSLTIFRKPAVALFALELLRLQTRKERVWLSKLLLLASAAHAYIKMLYTHVTLPYGSRKLGAQKLQFYIIKKCRFILGCEKLNKVKSSNDQFSVTAEKDR